MVCVFVCGVCMCGVCLCGVGVCVCGVWVGVCVCVVCVCVRCGCVVCVWVCVCGVCGVCVWCGCVVCVCVWCVYTHTDTDRLRIIKLQYDFLAIRSGQSEEQTRNLNVQNNCWELLGNSVSVNTGSGIGRQAGKTHYL